MSIEIQVDTELNAAYIKLSENSVARTVERSENLMVDVDEFGVAVGIELLDQATAIPFTELVSDFHVHSDVIDVLRMIRPSVQSFLTLTQSTDGVSQRQGDQQLV